MIWAFGVVGAFAGCSCEHSTALSFKARATKLVLRMAQVLDILDLTISLRAGTQEHKQPRRLKPYPRITAGILRLPFQICRNVTAYTWSIESVRTSCGYERDLFGPLLGRRGLSYPIAAMFQVLFDCNP